MKRTKTVEHRVKDKDGTEFILQEKKSFINTDSLSGPGEPIEGLSEYYIEGRAVNLLSSKDQSLRVGEIDGSKEYYAE